MQNTRQRILNYLINHHQATAPELGLILNQTQANIRHHLNILEKDGHIEVIGQTSHIGRGRPTHIYMLTKSAQDSALDELSSAMLRAMQAGNSQAQNRKILRKIAIHLAGTPTGTKKSITIQLSKAVQRLNDMNYKAHWEAHASAPQIIFGRCPYAQIISRHPELCQMDAYMLHHLTDVEFIQVEKISRTRQGPIHCRFILRQS